MRSLLFIVFSIMYLAPVQRVVAQAAPGSVNDGQPASTKDFFYTAIGGFEQAGLSSKPSETEAFARFYFQSPAAGKTRLWGAVRLLGAPNQDDTKGIFTVFTDPTGQIISDKFSSVGAAADFTVGGAVRISHATSPYSVDLILAFGGVTPFESNKVSQAFTVPVYGTAECNILYDKLSKDFNTPDSSGASPYPVVRSTDGKATGSTTACLLNNNVKTTGDDGTVTLAPITTIAFSSRDRTGFLYKDAVGVRLNAPTDKGKTCSINGGNPDCFMGSLDMTFGHDSAVTGGVFARNRWVFKADGLYPLPLHLDDKGMVLYIFGSFTARISKNQTDNTPLVLQPANVSTTGDSAIPNIHTVVLPLQQPDRDFYRIGVGLDIATLVKKLAK